MVRGFGAYALPFHQGIRLNPLVKQHLFKCICTGTLGHARGQHPFVDAICALVDRRDACVAIGLFDPIFAQKPVATQYLNAQFRRSHACLGAENFDQRG